MTKPRFAAPSAHHACALRPRIDNWAAVENESCPFQAPELRPIKLTGWVSNHPIHKDGPISTSLVQMLDESAGVAWTLSTEYELGAPSAEFAAKMRRWVEDGLVVPRPLKYQSDQVTLLAEQRAYRAAEARRGSPNDEPCDDPASEEEDMHSVKSSRGVEANEDRPPSLMLRGKNDGQLIPNQARNPHLARIELTLCSSSSSSSSSSPRHIWQEHSAS